MPEYLAPGVYVEEVDTGSKPIEGVSTSTAGFVGMTRRGPISGLPELVTSFAEFQRKFGGFFNLGAAYTGHNYLPYAVDGFFTNGGKRLYIMRVIQDNGTATAATFNAQAGFITRLRSNTVISPPADRNKIRPASLRGIRATPGTRIQLRMIKDGVVTDSPVRTVTAINRATGEVTVDNPISTDAANVDKVFDARYTTVYTDVETIDNAGLPTAFAPPPASLITIDRPNSFDIFARDPGGWGNEISIQAYPDSSARSVMQSHESQGVDTSKLRLQSIAGFYVGAWVEIDIGNRKRYRRINAIAGHNIQLDGPALTAADVAPELPAPDNTTIISVMEFRLVVSYGGVTEQFAGLTLENIPGHYYLDQINNGSTLLSVGAMPAGAGTHPFLFPSGGNGQSITLGGGNEGTPPDDADYVGADNGPGQRKGIRALEDIDQISIIAAPGRTSQVIQNALIEQCERLKDRFAILDPQPKAGNLPPGLNDIQAQRSQYDTKYAAIYYPRVLVYDPLTEKNIAVPPSGQMAGIYARTDIERGIHKAPANEVIRGITGLELKINKEEQDILNPSPVNINVLRDFRASNRGYRVWGGRVITSDPDWKYINVRRLFIYIEESIDEGTQWVVFEPNDEPLWARVRRTVSAFLTNVWRDGALQGRTPEEAFFVKCDRTTMTQADIDNGRLIILVGIAPVKPAEFVIFRIGQWAGGSSVEEG